MKQQTFVAKYTVWQHIFYSAILLTIILVGVPLLMYAGAWLLKGLIWYVNLWWLLPWPWPGPFSIVVNQLQQNR
jgi:hypothetical protein